MKLPFILSVVLALLVAVVLTGDSQQQSAGQLLQAGLYKEDVQGELDDAIQIYQRILKDFPNDRPVGAKALLRIGLCYEKLGKLEAQKAYRRLIQEFADQPQAVQIARERLQQLDTGALGAQVTGPTYRLILGDETPATDPFGDAPFDFSPSGDQLVFEGRKDNNKLYLADETGTLVRPLLNNLSPWMHPSLPRWSPDGRLIAYTAYRPTPNGEASREAIFVVSSEGGTPRQIGPDFDETKDIASLCWMPDSQHLICVVFVERTGDVLPGLYRLSLDGSIAQVSPGIMKVYWNMRLGGYSPDGRWLVFAMSDETLSGNNIWLLPTTADTALHLTDEPALDYHPTWAADGCAIYFVSTRTGSSNIFRLAIDPKTGSPKGKPQQVTFFSDAEIIFPKVLGDGGRIAFGLSKTTSSIRVADASRPDEARTLVRGYAPQLSPEGQTIYYLGEGPGMAGIFSVPTKGGIPRRLTQHRPVKVHRHVPAFHLSPNGQSIAFFTEFDEGRGLFSLPANGGEPQLLLKIETKEDVVPQWSPDGLKLAYAYGNGLYVVPASGGQSLKLAHLDLWEASTVRWSPDGKYLAAFGYAKPQTDNAVFVVPASGGERRQLTPSDVYKAGLEWHPDGQRLTYHVEQSKSETRQAYLDGRPPSLLVDHDNPTFWDHVGKWAPDGRRFFFDSVNVHTNEWGIYIYDEPSGNITLFAPNASLPNWSRDGKMMTWESHKHVNQIWLVENFLPKSKAVE